ncbi:MAG: OmpA family protein [Myxococcales bacterium]|jgi:outer membrane protein OmpA-like peptidoglycan-associated protein|nr:OmpA family protein [Myxococcales bacterium]
MRHLHLLVAPVITSGLLAACLLAPRSASAQTVTFGGSGAASTQNGASGSATGAAAGAPAAAPAPAPDSPEAEWADRDRKLNEPQVLSGGVGLLRTQHAQGGAPGQFRIQFMTEWFRAGFLCTPDMPCKNPRGPGQVTDDTMSHIGGHLALSATVWKYLEAYLGTGAFANSSDQNRPGLLQVLGDSVLGLKGFGAVHPAFHLGGAAELWLVNGTGSVGLDGGGTSAKFRGIATGDLRGLQKSIPARFSANVGYTLDNTGVVVEDVEKSRGTPVTRIERFGLGVNRVDHLDWSLGAEAFVAQDRLRPFVEYQMLVPVNRQGYECKQNNPSADKCLANEAIAPSKLTVGLRGFPWKQGFSLTAAFDIGVTGTKTFIEEMAPQAPWTLFLGAGWAVDTAERPPVEKTKLVEKVVEVRPPPMGRIKGFVHEEQKSEGVGNAIVSWDNHAELTSLATGPDGRFTTQELAEGPYAFTVRAEGFKPGQCQTTLVKGSPEVQLDCPLVALPRVGNLVGHVKDAESQGPISATIKMTDAQSKQLSGTADAQGNFRFELVSPGSAQITVEAEGYLTLVQPADIKVRQDNVVDLLLQKRPKNSLVTVGKNEITIKQQVQFAIDQAVILPESNQLLTEVADALIRNPRIKRVEVQGHTDNTGTADHNMKLSDDRANAVRNWLTSHGVPADRLVAKGFGQTKPLVPNVTAANKARNRRVQFIILDQDAPLDAPTAKPGPAAPKKK